MRTVKLSNQEINEAKKEASRYISLIKKEFSYGEFTDWNKVDNYKECYEISMELVNNPFVEVPTFN